MERGRGTSEKETTGVDIFHLCFICDIVPIELIFKCVICSNLITPCDNLFISPIENVCTVMVACISYLSRVVRVLKC